MKHGAMLQQTETMLEKRGLHYTFEPNLPLDQVREAEGNQVRLTEHRAPKAQVESYANAMAGGATFPAIVVNDRHEIIDGNTRRGAAVKVGAKTIAAYVCHNVNPLDARSLSVELNQTNGQRMDDAELRAFVQGAIADGHDPKIKSLSRLTGVSVRTLAKWVRVAKFTAKAEKWGMVDAETTKLADTVKAKIGVTQLRSVFLAVGQLAIDAGLPASDVGKIVTDANAAPSEDESLAIVEQAREDHGERIRELAAGFGVAKRKGTRSAMHVAVLLRYEIDDLLDVDPHKRPETLEKLTTLRDRLDEALERAEEQWKIADGSEPGDVDDEQAAA